MLAADKKLANLLKAQLISNIIYWHCVKFILNSVLNIFNIFFEYLFHVFVIIFLVCTSYLFLARHYHTVLMFQAALCHLPFVFVIQ